MSKEKKQLPNAENPERLSGLKRGKINKSAAGLKAVVSSAKMVYKEAGVSRGIKALMRLNQKDGFG